MNDPGVFLQKSCLKGVLLIDKPKNVTSFSLVKALRKATLVQKIGHAGTLDPFATGLMVMLLGKEYTTLSQHYTSEGKEYQCTIVLGVATDSYDLDGKITARSSHIPKREEVEQLLSYFQGAIQQIPPMFSAKKIKGKRLYQLARLGIEVARTPITVTVQTNLLSYEYPHLSLHIICSKGTYIRSMAHDIGARLGCGGHLSELRRLSSGNFHVNSSYDGHFLFSGEPKDLLLSKLEKKVKI